VGELGGLGVLHVGRLQVLCEVLRRGSFSSAAEALSYTQSAVSQAIARLESELGTPLVVRDRRGVRATAAGATLADHAEAIFAQLKAAEEDVAAVLGVRGGRLRVASFPSAGATLMPLAIAIFRRGHPDITLTLAEGEPEEIAPRLHAGEFDLALLFKFPGLAAEFDAGLRTVLLVEDPMHLALPVGHPLGAKPSLRLADLRDEDWVQTSQASACARHVVRLCVTAGFEPKVSFESDDFETVQGLVAAGVGVALIPRLALTHIHPGVAVRELSPRSPVRKVVAATLRGPAVAPAARTMLRILSDVARDYSSSLESCASGEGLIPAS
jgi:DNA-binding transcriptional LysR family regulator